MKGTYARTGSSPSRRSYLPGFLFGREADSRDGWRTNNFRLSWSGRTVNSHWQSRHHTSSGSMSLFLSSSTGISSRLAFARSSLMTRRAVGSRLCASYSRLPKAIAAALSNPSSFSSHISVALEFDAISSFSSVPGLLAGEMVFSAMPRLVPRAVLVLFLSGLARSLVALLVTAETTPWVCCKRSIPSCVSEHADSSSPGSNYPSTTAYIVGYTRGWSSSSTKKFCRSLFVLERPCRTWMDSLNRLPLFMSSPVLRQESLRRNSQHLLTIRFYACALPPPPPRKKHRGFSPVHPKRLPVHPRRWPVHPNLSPMMFEVLTGEFRWHLRSKHRGLRGRSGGIWAEDLLRWLGEGGATGRRRRRWRSSILCFSVKTCTHSGSQTISVRYCSCPTNLRDFEAVGDLSQLQRGCRRTFVGYA